MRLTDELCLFLAVALACAASGPAQGAKQSDADRERAQRLREQRQARAERKTKMASERAERDIVTETKRAIRSRGFAPQCQDLLKSNAPPRIVAYAARAEVARQSSIKSMWQMLREQARMLGATRYYTPDLPKHRYQQLRDAQARLISLYCDPTLKPPVFHDKLLVRGNLGAFRAPIKVIQVQNDTEALIERHWSVARPVSVAVGGGAREYGRTTTVMRPRNYSQTLWLKGYPTGGMADGSSFHLTGVFDVVGSRTYTTVVGAARTVLVIRPYDFARHLRHTK